MREYGPGGFKPRPEAKIPMAAGRQMQATKQDPLEFTKMAGGGNDFVVIDNRKGRVGDAVALTKKICTAHLSVGADGLILIEPSPRADFRMRYYNNDGSGGEFCANGTRCAARFAVLSGIAPKKMTIDTDVGQVGAEVGDGVVTLSLPSPHGFRAERPLRVNERVVRGSSIVMGVPHYVVFENGDLWSQDIVPLGRAIRLHPELEPDHGANVNFVVVRDEHAIEVRTYERGVEAETLSCGSGMVASVATAAFFGKVTSPVSVLTRSGITLRVNFARDGSELGNVQLTGDARVIFSAQLTPDTIEGFDADWARHPRGCEVAR
ncbi:MAG TPA: diaminopimelate epimerase [Thermoanaerobaculia bacterium]|nr:diaminopimelate epimerase [Thermoanaerobaculia bacterium]